MSDSSPKLRGFDLDGLLAEGLRSPVHRTTWPWTPPSAEELRWAIPRHEIIRLVGRGGMGAVYEARQVDLDRHVAIKILPAEFSEVMELAERFRREARMLCQLRHPNILVVHEFGETAAGHLFFIMESADGGDLAARLRRGPLSIGTVSTWVSQIAAALDAAHAVGIIHRDIKPSNILLNSDGIVKVADFGLAVREDQPLERLTHTGIAVGTFAYSAPEQTDGGAVDARSDVYSLGVLAYEMLTGQLPKGVFEPPSKVAPAVPVAVDAVILAAMKNDPAARYRSVGAFSEALSEAILPTAMRGRSKRWISRYPVRAALAALAITAFVTAVGLRQSRRAPIDAPTVSGPRTVVYWGSSTNLVSHIPDGLAGVKRVRSGWDHCVALLDDGRVVAWGANVDGRANIPIGLSGVADIAAGAEHTLALKADGTVVAWGLDDHGQTKVPVGLTEVKAVAAGRWHSVALRRDGTVVVWGGDEFRQCQVPSGLVQVESIAAGNTHTLALRRDGSIVAWGERDHGQCTVPPGLDQVASIAAGGFHNIALRRDGTIVVWGNNDAGQAIVPLALGLNRVKAISAGYRHTLAITTDDRVFAWGWNKYGQSEAPAGLSDIEMVSAGFSHSLAILRHPVPAAQADTDPRSR